MKKIIVITGTPGTGKTTLAKELAKSLKNAEFISANDVIKKEGLSSRKAKDGSMIARLAPLKRSLERRIRASKSTIIILEGHILCEIKIRNAVAIVLREHLDKLRHRMKERGYPTAKINDNIVSEATDYCGIRAEANYNEVYEFLSDKNSTAKLIKVINGGKVKKEDIELLHELDSYLKTDRSFLK